MNTDNKAEWAEARGSVVIERPNDVVFAFASNPHNDNQWLNNLGEVQWLTPGAVRLGSRFRQFPIFLGARIQVEWDVTAFVADRHLTGQSSSGPLQFERRLDCEAEGTNTLLTSSVRIRIPAGLPFVTKSTADAQLGNAAARALARLKDALERTSPAGPS
jgi:Polyketide cyclase / dehydrase and lipid transport